VIVHELEDFIHDWYYNEPSHEFARQLGAFVLQFLAYLESTGLSEESLRRHANNCRFIGKFECDYGYHDVFSPAIFLEGRRDSAGARGRTGLRSTGIAARQLRAHVARQFRYYRCAHFHTIS
jgi:hypothetical protein